VVQSLAGLAETKGIDLIIDFKLNPSGFDVIGDKHRLREILVNLLGNAIKYTEKGSVVIRGCSRIDESSSEETGIYRFEIEDTGPGIEEAKLNWIFEPFTQIHNGLKKSARQWIRLIHRQECHQSPWRKNWSVQQSGHWKHLLD